MRHQRPSKVILQIVFGVVLLMLGGFSLVLLSQNNRPAPPVSGFAATPTSKPLLTSTPLPTVTPAPSTTSSSIMVLTATPGAHEVMDVSFVNLGGASIRYTAKKPLLSLEDALQVVYNGALHRKPGEQYEGKTITLQAVYGLVTIGQHLDLSGFASVKNPPECKDWAGPCNIELQDCTLEASCTPTGKKLTKIIDRPMWILDYTNTPYWGSGMPGQPAPKHGHSIYAVDEETKMIMGVWGYAPIKE